MSDESTEDQSRLLLTEILKRRGATVHEQGLFKVHSGREVVDLYAIRGNQTFLFEIKSEPATRGTINALLQRPEASAATKVIVSPGWDAVTQDLAAASKVKLVTHRDLLSGNFDPL